MTENGILCISHRERSEAISLIALKIASSLTLLAMTKNYNFQRLPEFIEMLQTLLITIRNYLSACGHAQAGWIPAFAGMTKADVSDFLRIYSDIETFEKCSILFKFKEGENFNRRNTLSILRIKI